jgi:hypothetical protein
MFAEGGTTVRSSTELGAQWATLSEEDKAMVRRDCMVHMQQPAGATDSTGAAGSATTGSAATDSTTTGDTSQTGTSGDASAAATTGTTGTLNVTTEQMDQICAATKDL